MTGTAPRKLVCVAGLPRAGSTLLCQLLAQHPGIYSPGHSSPLAPLLNDIRHRVSDNEFFLAQLDVDFDRTYGQLVSAYQGFIDGWFTRAETSVVVDKNRGWLPMVETLEVLHPNYMILVCVRDLAQIFGSIEAQHDRTRLIDFPDHIDAHNPFVRADRLFGRGGIVGGPLSSIEYVRQIKDSKIQDRILYIPFEYLVGNVVESMQEIYTKLGVEPFQVDPGNLKVAPHESDSYYRFKYRHKTHRELRAPEQHEILPGIASSLRNKFKWYYQAFYPDKKNPDDPAPAT
jgi:sulfotransferase